MIPFLSRGSVLFFCLAFSDAFSRSGLEEFWSESLPENIKYIIEDLYWLQSSLSFNPNWLAIKSCDSYNSLSQEDTIKAARGESCQLEIPEPVETVEPVEPSLFDKLDDIWKTSGLLDSIPLDISTVNSTTWALFSINFILTVVICLSSLGIGEEEPPAYLTRHYKPRSRTLYRKTKNPVDKKRFSESSRRLHKIKKKKIIEPYRVEKQLQQQLSESDKRLDVFQLRDISPRLFSKKKTKSDLEIRKRSKRKTPLSLEGKIYNLDNVEEIPWEVLDILLCIRNPCNEHDHDHICVVGNNVYTIPNWSIPNTSQTPDKTKIAVQPSKQYDAGDNFVTDYDYDDECDSNDDNDDHKDRSNDEIFSISPYSYYRTFQPIQPATIIDVTDDVVKPEAVYVSPSVSHDDDSSFQLFDKVIVSEQPSEANSSVMSSCNPATTISSVEVMKPIIDPVGSESIDLEDESCPQSPSPTLKDVIIGKAADIKNNVKTMVYGAGIVIVEKITSSGEKQKITPNECTKDFSSNINDISLCEDIGLPCANSSFKTDIDQGFNGLGEIYLDDDDDHDINICWTEDSLDNDKDIILHDNTKREPEEELDVSRFINNISNRLVNDSQDIHNLSKTLSFYGDVSALELGASWLVKGLLNQVVEDLNISSRAEAMVTNLSSTFSSFLHNNSLLNNTT